MSGGNVIKKFFKLCGKVVFNIFFEEIFEEHCDNAAAVLGNEAQFFNADVFSFLQNGNNRRIG